MAVRAVTDTNVLVSGLLVAEGPPREVLDAWLDGRFTLVTSPYQLEEVTHVLAYPRVAERIRLEPAELAAILSGLMTLTVVTTGQPRRPSLAAARRLSGAPPGGTPRSDDWRGGDLQRPGITRDPKDDAIVACAEEGSAEYIVSGDHDLLLLGEYRAIRVLTPRQFLELLAQP
jgi:predicted nucleic acid-binding protein